MNRRKTRPSTLWSYDRTRTDQREIAQAHDAARRWDRTHPGTPTNPESRAGLLDRLSLLERLEARLIARIEAEGRS